MSVTQNGKGYNRTLAFTIMMLAAISGSLMQTSLGTALPSLMKAFDISISTAQQATTWFLLTNGIMVPLSAYLANRVPTKYLQLFASFALLIGIAISMLTPENSNSWWIFVAGRIVTALGVGVIMPLLQIVIINMYAPEERGTAMGMMGLVVGMGPAIGPTLTGWILKENHTILGITLSDHWQSIFVIPFIIIAIATILTPIFVKNFIQTSKIKMDYFSVVLSTVGFGLFLWGFTNVSTQGWGDWSQVILPISAGIIVVILFGWRQLKLDKPFLDIRVFMNKEFTIASAQIILLTMAMYGVEMMLPTYLQNVRGLNPFDSGLTLMWGALCLGLISPIAGILYNKVGTKRLSFVGFSMLALGTLPYIYLTPETPTLLITVLYTMRMAGVALTMMPLTTAAMSALPDSMGSHGTAANNTVRQVASSVVVALMTSVVQNVTSNHLPSSSLKTTDPILYASKALNASMDGFQIAFILSFIFAVIGIFLLIFLKSGKESNK
ncbi:MDR family MFS transporter [Fructobacillus evanidus]|uniref:Includes anhydromuropeptide permease AmpG (ProP) n=1 Tax=Fructobacillus evanidus TaxID=3064281 RepID=A0ABN9YQ26_9LACO|nr:MFS family permease [Fructobacillus sp. LMG 32999]CAK1233960.1 MFS family permease [Fructobacillus sp. LMG 32999]CAK1235738.1 MFS family permease [Fructobacillus sp. LMG 32999]CAK1236459.1 MFS family permease [Fructobacillus sp. LMG 32999]CAK1237583.1 MFS family permease [Fructobacillus sp. LMG 32999]